jgi:hypothetical protein
MAPYNALMYLFSAVKVDVSPKTPPTVYNPRRYTPSEDIGYRSGGHGTSLTAMENARTNARRPVQPHHSDPDASTDRVSA